MVLATVTGAAGILKGYTGTLQEVINAVENDVAGGRGHFLLHFTHNGTDYAAVVKAA